MSTIEVFDPPMCCSTGVCGPSVDPALAKFAADLTQLTEQGITVTRHNLSQEPKAFVDDNLIRDLLNERGEDVLPVILVNGELRSSGRYPARDELDVWVLTGERVSELDAATAELVALGAAVGANCESCLKFHYNEARRLGVSTATMVAAVRIAQTVKDSPARSMLELTAKLLATTPETLRSPSTATDATPATSVSPDSANGHDAAPCCEPSTSSGAATQAATSSCCGDTDADAQVLITAKDQGSSCCG